MHNETDDLHAQALTVVYFRELNVSNRTDAIGSDTARVGKASLVPLGRLGKALQEEMPEYWLKTLAGSQKSLQKDIEVIYHKQNFYFTWNADLKHGYYQSDFKFCSQI